MAYRLLREFRQAFTRLDTPPFSNRRHPGSDIALMRKANERTVEATWKRIGTLLKEFTAKECANYVRNSGYVST